MGVVQKEICSRADSPLKRGQSMEGHFFTSETATKGNQVMRFIGADLHKKSITFCVVEILSGKTIVRQRMRVQCCEGDRIAELLVSHAPYELVVEATIGYEWFASLAEKSAERVVLAHAGKLRVIAESTRKTDKVDAFVLAEFLAKDMIPEAWRPTPRVRQHRSLSNPMRQIWWAV